MGTPVRLLACAVVALTMAPACAPVVAAAPCNEDDDCAQGELCLRGVCSEGAALGPRPDAGVRHDDAGSDPAEADSGRPGDDAGAPSPDAGNPPVDAGDGDAGRTDDGGAPVDSGGPDDAGPSDGGGDPVDSGPDPVLDAGPPGIISFTAEPSTVTIGGSVTLQWETNEVSSCVLEGARGTFDANDEVVVERPASRPYTLLCTGEGGEAYEAEVVVTVQCPTPLVLSSLTIGSDADLEARGAEWGGATCVDVEGDVVIGAVTTTDLTPLYGLRKVGGSLNIGGGLNLERLDGLELVNDVDDDLRLGFQENAGDPEMFLPALTSVHGLSALARVGLDVEIVEADSLRSLAGLERLVTIGDDLEVDECPLLESLAGLRRLERIGNALELTDAPALRKLGFSSLTTINGSIALNSVGLVDLLGLARVESDPWSIWIHHCDSLPSLRGLEGITRVRAVLSLQYNDALTSLDGLENLAAAERVVIRVNNALTALDLPALTAVDFTGGQNCSGDFCDGDLVIERNDALVTLDGFGALTHVDRNLWIYDNDALEQIGGFRALKYVDNDLIVRGHAALQRLSGLRALEEADDIMIEYNPVLAELKLDNLTRVDDDVYLVANGKLQTLSGLSALGFIGGDLEINNHAQLTSLGLSALTSVGDFATCARGCALEICGNGNLSGEQVDALLAAASRPVDETDTAVLTETNGRCP